MSKTQYHEKDNPVFNIANTGFHFKQPASNKSAIVNGNRHPGADGERMGKSKDIYRQLS